MLSELELELIAAVKASPIAANLREVEALPDGDAATLMRKFKTAAPAVYAVAGPVAIGDEKATLRFDLICVAGNARGNDAARRGDGQTIGLYQMLDALSEFLDGHKTTGAAWYAKSINFAKDKVWMDNGLSVGSLQLETTVRRTGVDETTLGAFVTFHADYDVEPFQAQAEHDKWTEEPPDYTTSAPDLTDTTALPQ